MMMMKRQYNGTEIEYKRKAIFTKSALVKLNNSEFNFCKILSKHQSIKIHNINHWFSTEGHMIIIKVLGKTWTHTLFALGMVNWNCCKLQDPLVCRNLN